MQLTIFNGSPRGKVSNSEILIQWLASGTEHMAEVNVQTIYLRNTAEHASYITQLQRSDVALLVFPLYTDSMPGIVMAFLERLDPFRKSLSGLKLGFVVHSGFPEAIHSRAVERYLQWLAKDLGAAYLGTVVMGGSNSLRETSPDKATGKRALFAELGHKFIAEQSFDPELVKKISGMEKFSKPITWGLKIAVSTGLLNTFWDEHLKKNNAYPERNATPYVDRL